MSHLSRMFYNVFNYFPGVIEDVQEKNAEFFYDISVNGRIVAKMTSEKSIMKRTLTGKTKYKKDEVVQFQYKDEVLIGKILIVDAYGTFEQCKEPSYDILVQEEGPDRFYKHIMESNIINLLDGKSSD